MFKKLIATIVIMAFTNSYGSAPLSQKNALNAAFSELEYSLTVEWDQQDQQVAAKMLSAFEKEVKLLQKEGLSNAELVDGSLARIKNRKTQEELTALFQVVEANQMSEDEARNFIVSAMKEGQVEGASWTGDRLRTKTLLILAVVLILVVIVVKNHDNDDDDDEGCNEDCGDDDDGDNDEGGPRGNNGWGNCDQDAPGGSLPNNGAENDQSPGGNGSSLNRGWENNCVD